MKPENKTRKHKLIEIEWPDFGLASPPAPIPLEEYQDRLGRLRERMASARLTHLLIYGDREHSANLLYLTGFDPRFEEALLIIGPAASPLLVVGNECEGYLPVSPLYVHGQLRAEVYQPFSLLNQPRDKSRQLSEILAGEGINGDSSVGCIGWKYFGDAEHPSAQHAIEIPAYIVDSARELAGRERVRNASAMLMSPRNGMRTIASAAEIAYFEYTNVIAAEGIKRMMFGMREGMADNELMALGQINGVPLGCHPTLATGAHWQQGLYSPTGQPIQRGYPLSTNICYWGSNICRAGWIAESAADLPADAQDYIEKFAGIYMEVVADWFELLTIGRRGHDLWQLIDDRLPFAEFGVFLNPGHLIHYDEWLSSPIYEGSDLPLQSGMVMQVDIIPFSKTYGSSRIEDGVVLADQALRDQLAQTYPAMWGRMQARRRFMMDTLGFRLPAEILPLSNIPGIVPPFFLAPNTVLALF